MTHERLEALLAGPARWSELIHLETVGSTNDEIVGRVSDDPRPGVVVVADHQTAGRGRLRREWEDEPGGSLLFSVLVDPPDGASSLLPLAAGMAVCDAVRRRGIRAELKWPNDVMIADRKLAGILVERREVGGAPAIVIGIGCNVDWRGSDHGPDRTSLAEELDAEIDRWELLADVLRSLDTWLDDLVRDPGRLLATYRARSSTIGRDVRVILSDDEVAGRAVDVDSDGALLLETVDGRKARVTAGDVVHVRPADE